MSDQRVNWDQIKNVPPFLQERDSLVWEAPISPPDDIVTDFYFTTRPKLISFAGLILFENFGYKVLNNISPYQVQFIDVNGTIIVPKTGDVIFAQTR